MTSSTNTFAVARHRNVLSLMDLLPKELIGEVLLYLAALDPPSYTNPMGWLTQALGVCHLWRQVALHCPDLWAENAGTFLSPRMTLFALEHARSVALRFDGQPESGIGPDIVLHEWQLPIVDSNLARICSLIHNDYRDWSLRFSAGGSLPRLEEAVLWDDAEPGTWQGWDVDTPVLRRLCLNNSLMPFNAPNLRTLHLKSNDSDFWQISTYDLITFLQRVPRLESLWMNELPSPATGSSRLPPHMEFFVELSQLRDLQIEGRLRSHEDVRMRLGVPNTRGDLHLHMIYREDYVDSEENQADDSEYYKLDGMWLSTARTSWFGLRELFQMCCLEVIASENGFILKSWPCWANETDTWVGDSMGHRLRDMNPMPMLVLELPQSKRPSERAFDRPGMFLKEVSWAAACVPYYHVLHIDLTDAPVMVGSVAGFNPSLGVFPHHSLIHLTVSYERQHYLLSHVLDCFEFVTDQCGITLVDFPCATFPSTKRFDKNLNARAWNTVVAAFRHRKEQKRDPLFLTLAESMSELTECNRWDPLGEYEHTIAESYEDAVAAANAQGYSDIASLVLGFEDLRVNSWPYPAARHS